MRPRRAPLLREFAVAPWAAIILWTLLPAWRSAAQSQPEPGATWRFAVAGDSRNCGDIVMPAIAEGAWAIFVRDRTSTRTLRSGPNTSREPSPRTNI